MLPGTAHDRCLPAYEPIHGAAEIACSREDLNGVSKRWRPGDALVPPDLRPFLRRPRRLFLAVRVRAEDPDPRFGNRLAASGGRDREPADSTLNRTGLVAGAPDPDLEVGIDASQPIGIREGSQFSRDSAEARKGPPVRGGPVWEVASEWPPA